MKGRVCDMCKEPIMVKTDFVALLKISWEGRLMKTRRVGDMCMDCFGKENHD